MKSIRIAIGVMVVCLLASCVDNEKSPAYKDASLAIEERVDDLLGRMTLEEKVGQLLSRYDNFTPADTKKAVDLIAGRFETESSGGITIENLRDYAECGVDFISVGALTHSVKGLDMSFKAC